MVRVTHFQRKPTPGAFSIERFFEDVRSHLPEDISVTLRVSPYPSRGLVNRLADAWEARKHQAEINHVLGDIHFVMTWLTAKKSILTIHDCVTLERLSGLRRSVFWLFWYRIPVAKAARIAVISEFSKQQLLKWVDYPEDRIAIIPPGLSEEFQYQPRASHSARPRVLHIGSTPNKNLTRVIDALKGLDVHLAIVGNPTEAQRQGLNSSGINHSIQSELTREELVAEYAKADILLFASTYEGFGMPIIEAQAVGRPVITSNTCSMPEAAGGAAHLVDPTSVQEIREAVEKVSSDREYAQSLIERGRANAEKYAAHHIAEKYAKLYRLVAAEESS